MGKEVVKFVKLGKPNNKFARLDEQKPFLKCRPLKTEVIDSAKKIAEGLNDTTISLDRLKVSLKILTH